MRTLQQLGNCYPNRKWKAFFFALRMFVNPVSLNCEANFKKLETLAPHMSEFAME